MSKSIPTAWPGKGDLVKGHRVFAYWPGLPAVPGVIIAASDARVKMEIEPGLSILGLPRRTEFTWRRSYGSYQQAGLPSRSGAGLLLDRRPRK